MTIASPRIADRPARSSIGGRAARVDAVRQLVPLPRKPLPVLLMLIKVYVDGTDGVGSLAFGHGVSSDDAPDILRARLDAAEVRDFGLVVARRAAEHRPRWVGWKPPIKF